jgi:hypothetical protein
MSKSALFGFGCAMALASTLVAPAAHADPAPHYKYVALDQVAMPAPYAMFFPSAVVDGRVYGTAVDAAFSVASVAVYSNGSFTIGAQGLASGFPFTLAAGPSSLGGGVASRNGIVGGADLFGDAAVFNGATATVVPAMPNQLTPDMGGSSSVVGLGDHGLALVAAQDMNGNFMFGYFQNGAVTPINFGLPDPVFGAFMNEDGLIGATKQESASDPIEHAYRYDPRSKTSTLLPPFAGDPTDVMALVQGINRRGEVLGYSFTQIGDPNYHERVGVWSRGAFQSYFEETINTQVLLFNDRNQIVITDSSDGTSYLVPQPGTRLDLAAITSNIPDGLTLAQGLGMDDAGNITGLAADQFGGEYPFLLVPLRDGETDGGQAHHGNCPIPWALGHSRQHHHK